MIDTEKRERRDWTLLIFIIPIGILLIVIVAQMAVRLVPIWSVNANMNSNLEPNPNSARPFALLEPILPQILTPMAWAESYLTPGADISFPPFLTFEPSATPSPTVATPTPSVETPTATATTPSPSSTDVAATPPPSSGGGSGGGGGSTVCTDPAATNNGGSLPCTYPPPPPTTCQDTNANNYGGPLPCTYPPPPPICPGANNPGGPLPCDYGITSTPDSSYTFVDPPPPEIGVGAPPDNTGPGDANIGNIYAGTYIVISLGITVENIPDNNYDLAYYEWNNGGGVYLDWIIIGISNDPTGATYYEIFNWGNNDPDENSNVDYTELPDTNCPIGTEECDNRKVPVSDNAEVPVLPTEDILYDPDHVPANTPTTPESNGPLPQTGILIDVDTADSDPPPGTYDFVVIINPNSGGDAAQVDAIQTVEVPTP